MNEIRIEGGNPLTGEVRIQGSKNAALPMMAAALLHKGKSVLHHCPKIADVFVMEEILRELGMQIHHEGDTLTLDPAHVERTEIDCCEGQKMRSSVILLGSLLGRYHSASVPHPRTLYDENGYPHVCLDEAMKRRLEIKLIHAIVTTK